jgi:hypothetical protein
MVRSGAMDAARALGVGPRRGLPLPRQVPGWLVALVVASGAAWVLAGDWLAGAGLWILWAGWRYLRPDEGIPVLALAFTFQWTQVMAGIYYHALSGRRLPPMDLSDYRPMVLLGLAGLVALLVGLRLGMGLVPRAAPVPHPPLAWHALIAAYVLSVAATGTLQELAWDWPAVTQGILAVTYVRFALLFLILRRLTEPRIRWGWLGLILALEVTLGFTGYFAGFREPLMMAAAALIAVFDRRRLRHWVVLMLLVLTMFLTGLMWMGVRTTYRLDFQRPALTESRIVRLERVAALSSEWLRSDLDEFLQDLDALVDRLWAVYYPALALDRVPSIVPHENGLILSRAVLNLVTPRIFFPDKEALESDSEIVMRYAGVLVAGPERETSIAFGYVGESYVDFGVPLMFAPILFYGLLMGMGYRLVLRLVRHRELAVALVTVVFWLSLYLFERSWIKTVALSAILMVYLVGLTIVVDRLLVARPRWRAAASRALGPMGPEA